MPTLEGWMPVREAAEFLGLSVSRMHQLIEEYSLEIFELNPRYKLVKEEDVDRLAEMDRPDGIHKDRRKTAKK